MTERVEAIRRRRVPGNSLAANPMEWPCEDVTYLLTALAQAEWEIATMAERASECADRLVASGRRNIEWFVKYDAVRSALAHLLAELSDLQIEAVREGCGNTNAAVLRLRVDEARAALEGRG